MSVLGKRLKELREGRQLLQKELADALGISRNTLASWETGHRTPEMSAVQRLADYFGVSLDYLLGRSDPWQTAESPVSYPSPGAPNEMLRLPVVGAIRAGEPVPAADSVEGHVSVPAEDVQDGEYFFLRVKGDAMTGARIHGGDLVLVRKQPEVEDGDIAVVLVGNDDEAILRRLHRTNGKWLLQPENPMLRPAVVPRRQVKIIGKVVRVQFELR
ncbi:MAG: LexA family transcriptional regulator [Bacillota bacterium]|nr:LexA family transcriptional regulator [Bacillota bacterium]